MTAFTMADADGISIQTTDGENSVTVKEDSVVMKVGTATMTLTSAEIISTVPIRAPQFTDGTLKIFGHVHTNPEGGDVGPMKNP